MSCWKRRLYGQIVETKKSGEEENKNKGGECNSHHGGRDHVQTISGRRTLRIGVEMLRRLTVPPMVTFPDSYGGNLVALHEYQPPDRSKLNIQ